MANTPRSNATSELETDLSTASTPIAAAAAPAAAAAAEQQAKVPSQASEEALEDFLVRAYGAHTFTKEQLEEIKKRNEARAVRTEISPNRSQTTDAGLLAKLGFMCSGIGIIEAADTALKNAATKAISPQQSPRK